MHRRRTVSSLLSAVLAAGIVLAAAVGASGTTHTAVSASKSVTVNGVVYAHSAKISTDTGGHYAVAHTNLGASTTVPSGWLGTYPRLWSSSGTIVKTVGYSYSSRAATSWSSTVVHQSQKAGSFYSQGCVQVWNGKGYNTYCTERSPNQNA